MEPERMFPHRWMRVVPTLKGRDLTVWWYLSQRQGTNSFIRTSKADIARWCRCSIKSVDASIVRLVEAKMLQRESGQRFGKGNQYSVLVPDWVEPYGSGRSDLPSKRAHPSNGSTGSARRAAGVGKHGGGGRQSVDAGKDLEVPAEDSLKYDPQPETKSQAKPETQPRYVEILHGSNCPGALMCSGCIDKRR